MGRYEKGCEVNNIDYTWMTATEFREHVMSGDYLGKYWVRKLKLDAPWWGPEKSDNPSFDEGYVYAVINPCISFSQHHVDDLFNMDE